jgi:hypothetical protein
VSRSARPTPAPPPAVRQRARRPVDLRRRRTLGRRR